MSIVETPVSKGYAHICMRKIREYIADALQRVEAWGERSRVRGIKVSSRGK